MLAKKTAKKVAAKKVTTTVTKTVAKKSSPVAKKAVVKAANPRRSPAKVAVKAPAPYNWSADLERIGMLLFSHPAVFTKPRKFHGSIELYAKQMSSRVCMKFGAGRFSIKLSTCRDYLVVTANKQ
jgi:hypothetical protein